MATTQYIGARYVPLFAEPIEWDKTKQYEPLTIVTYDGNSYTSRQFVPTGVEITNTAFWALTGNFNAQVEQYRKEVIAYDGRITAAQTDATNALALAKTNESDIAANDAELAGTADSGLKTLITNETTRATKAEDANKVAIGAEVTRATAAEGSNRDAIDAEVARATAAEKANATAISEEGSARTAAINSILSRFPVGASDLRDGSVTATKINQTGVKSILNGFTVHYFDNKNPNADNVGLVVPSNARISGFYVEELTLLCITQLQVYGPWSSIKAPDGKVVLPSYVPAIVPPTTLDAKEYILNGGACVWSDSNFWKTWCGYSLMAGRQICPRSNVESGDWYTTFGSTVAILRPYMTSLLSDQNYDALVSANEMM
jgi:hypothetical protein